MSLEGFLISLVGACQAVAGLGVVLWITQSPLLANRGEHLALALFVFAVGVSFLLVAHFWDKKRHKIELSLQRHK